MANNGKVVVAVASIRDSEDYKLRQGCLKVCNRGSANIAAYSQVKAQHRGRAYIRLVQESFSIQGPFGEHICLVFEPLREPLWLLGKHLGSNGVPPAVLKPFLRILLQGLVFLHSECHVIHTGRLILHLYLSLRLTDLINVQI